MMLAQLKKSLGECKFALTSICEDKSSYETIYAERFHICDNPNDERPVKIVFNGKYQLTVLNPQLTEVVLVKTDHCLLKKDIKKCDCVLYSDDKLFFIEIKSSGNRGVRRRGAVEQLGSTIEIFLQAGINLSGREVKAIICFESDLTKPTSASANTRRAMFSDKYATSLEEGNEIIF